MFLLLNTILFNFQRTLFLSTFSKVTPPLFQIVHQLRKVEMSFLIDENKHDIPYYVNFALYISSPLATPSITR